MASPVKELEAAGFEPRQAVVLATMLQSRPAGLRPEWVLGIAVAVLVVVLGTLWVEATDHGDRLVRLETQMEAVVQRLDHIVLTQAQILQKLDALAAKFD